MHTHPRRNRGRFDHELAQNPAFARSCGFREMQKVTHKIMSQNFQSAMEYINLADSQAVKDSWKGLQESGKLEQKGYFNHLKVKQSRIGKTNIVTVTAYHRNKKENIWNVSLAQGVLGFRCRQRIKRYLGCGPLLFDPR